MKLGIDAVAYLNTAASGGTAWTTPTWTPLDFISDFAEKTDWDNAEVIIRRSWVKQGAKTVLDVGVTCKMLREPNNPNYAKIRAALWSRQTVDMLFLDAAKEVVGAEGVRYIAQVIKGGGSQNTNEALFRDIEFTPFPDPDPTHIPQWAQVAVAGTVVFTNITLAGTATLTGAMAADAVMMTPDDAGQAGGELAGAAAAGELGAEFRSRPRG